MDKFNKWLLIKNIQKETKATLALKIGLTSKIFFPFPFCSYLDGFKAKCSIENWVKQFSLHMLLTFLSPASISSIFECILAERLCLDGQRNTAHQGAIWRYFSHVVHRHLMKPTRYQVWYQVLSYSAKQSGQGPVFIKLIKFSSFSSSSCCQNSVLELLFLLDFLWSSHTMFLVCNFQIYSFVY